MPQLRTGPRRLAAALGALLLGAALTTAAVPARAAAPQAVGYVRLAHLSPDTPAVDVHLSAPGAAEVEPGRWRLRLGGGNGPTTAANVTLDGGRVYSLLVLDAKRGGLTTELREDARAGAVTPTGGVAAGGGGLADDGLGTYPWIIGGVLAGTVVVGVVLVRRRRRPVW